jgi:hypothetical protein
MGVPMVLPPAFTELKRDLNFDIKLGLVSAAGTAIAGGTVRLEFFTSFVLANIPPTAPTTSKALLLKLNPLLAIQKESVWKL